MFDNKSIYGLINYNLFALILSIVLPYLNIHFDIKMEKVVMYDTCQGNSRSGKSREILEL